MTEAEFESLTWSTEAEAYEAGLKYYGDTQLITSRNPDGSWYVYSVNWFQKDITDDAT